MTDREKQSPGARPVRAPKSRSEDQLTFAGSHVGLATTSAADLASDAPQETTHRAVGGTESHGEGAAADPFAVFEDRHLFADEVHGLVHASDLERDAIDTPEYQRLFRINQLGFIDLLYPSANHTRGAHGIGTLHTAQDLIRALRDSQQRLVGEKDKKSSGAPAITRSEEILIRLGALLHDIPHGPYSHDIEKKTHHIYPYGVDENDAAHRVKVQSFYGPYEKHDDFKQNPALYLLLLDRKRSVLAQTLALHSPAFWDRLQEDVERPEPGRPAGHLRTFVDLARNQWPSAEDEILPALLFHLLAFEHTRDALTHANGLEIRNGFEGVDYLKWQLGPAGDTKTGQALHYAWFQPYRHDIIGDTLSADLLDYLDRDMRRLGMHGKLDKTLLRFYILVQDPDGASWPRQGLPLFRCAIDLLDHKRGTVRVERINDIFRLLHSRHEIHEKAVFHRIVQAGIAMLSRSLILLGGRKPSRAALYNLNQPNLSLTGDDHFLEQLLTTAEPEAGTQTWRRRTPAARLLQKIAERRMYRPLMVIPGHCADALLKTAECRPEQLRELAAIVDSPRFAPFFIAISNLIQRYLSHRILDEESVTATLTRLASAAAPETPKARPNDELAEYLQPPADVIFWTTPFKQLYKDPSLVVTDRDVVRTIEELGREKPDGQTSARLRSVLSRVSAAIDDSAARYEALWKLYVFLSDGLFFSGSLAKFLSKHPCCDGTTAHESHKACLANAQRLVVHSVRAAWELWKDQIAAIRSEARREGADTDERARSSAAIAAWLATPGDMTAVENLADGSCRSELRRLLTMTAATWHDKWAPIGVDDVSTVAISNYLHSDEVREPCRDIRYKSDPGTVLAEWAKAPVVMGGDDAEERAITDAVLTFYSAQNRNGRSGRFGREDIREIGERIGPALLAEIKSHVVQRRESGAPAMNPLWSDEDVVRLWRGDGSPLKR